MRWRLELTPFSYDIVYRKGTENVVADSFSRICGAINLENLFAIHKSLCHPGITRMMHWIRCNNLPYSVEDVRKMTASCSVCAEIKPRFYRGNNGKLIKATYPFERLSIDFKGPLPSNSKNHYLLTIVDEYSRFPFAFPSSDMTSSTVIKHLSELFSVFGLPSYIHSDRGSSFISQDIKSFLHSKGVATSHSTPYNPQGNGQVESYNGIIWRTVMLNLRTNRMDVKQWEHALPQALNSIRSLLCTSTNTTPHERMFHHPRKTGSTIALPTWLTTPGPVLLKKHVRNNKYEPLVEEVQLIDSNPSYARVQFRDGRQSTVSLKHLAPAGNEEYFTDHQDLSECQHLDESRVISDNVDAGIESNQNSNDVSTPNSNAERTVTGNSTPITYLQTSSKDSARQSDSDFQKKPSRVRKQPQYLSDYVLN